MDTTVFNAVFWTAFITSIVGMVLKLSNMCYRSKCKEIDCWGIKVIRDVVAEEEYDKANPLPPISHAESPTSKNNLAIETNV